MRTKLHAFNNLKAVLTDYRTVQICVVKERGLALLSSSWLEV